MTHLLVLQTTCLAAQAESLSYDHQWGRQQEGYLLPYRYRVDEQESQPSRGGWLCTIQNSTALVRVDSIRRGLVKKFNEQVEKTVPPQKRLVGGFLCDQTLCYATLTCVSSANNES